MNIANIVNIVIDIRKTIFFVVFLLLVIMCCFIWSVAASSGEKNTPAEQADAVYRGIRIYRGAGVTQEEFTAGVGKFKEAWREVYAMLTPEGKARADKIAQGELREDTDATVESIGGGDDTYKIGLDVDATVGDMRASLLGTVLPAIPLCQNTYNSAQAPAQLFLIALRQLRSDMPGLPGSRRVCGRGNHARVFARKET